DGAERVPPEPGEPQRPGSHREASGEFLLGRERGAATGIRAAAGRRGTSPLSRGSKRRARGRARLHELRKAFASAKAFSTREIYFACFSCSSIIAMVFSTSAFIGLFGSSLRYCWNASFASDPFF